MKKRIAGAMILLLLTGCGMEGITEEKIEETQKIIEETQKEEGQFVTSTQSQETAADVDKMEEQLLDLEQYSVENKKYTDSQPEFMWSRAASSELGIYYWGNPTLMFYDKAAKVAVPLCNRPNCSHDSNQCNAAFGIYSSDGMDIYRDMIFYYDDSVYIVGDDPNSYVNLYKVAPDGSSWEKYMTLFKAEKNTAVEEDGSISVHWRYPDVFLHQGYVYYVDNSESVPKLRRIQMGGSEVEVIRQSEGERSMLYRVKCYGDYVFFQSAYYIGEMIQGGIYAYNTKTGEVVLVKADAVRDYYVVDDILYYDRNCTIYWYNLVTGENKELPITYTDTDTGYSNFFVDKSGIYIFKSGDIGSLYVYDEDGMVIGSLLDEEVTECNFGKDGIFYGGSMEGKSAMLEVEDVFRGKGKWIDIP